MTVACGSAGSSSRDDDGPARDEEATRLDDGTDVAGAGSVRGADKPAPVGSEGCARVTQRRAAGCGGGGKSLQTRGCDGGPLNPLFSRPRTSVWTPPSRRADGGVWAPPSRRADGGPSRCCTDAQQNLTGRWHSEGVGPGTEESSPATCWAYRNFVDLPLRTDDRPRRAEHRLLQRPPLVDVLRTHDCALPRSVLGELLSLGAPIGFNPSLREGLIHTDGREKVRSRSKRENEEAVPGHPGWLGSARSPSGKE